MPRHANAESNDTARERSIGSDWPSQYRALTWESPTSPAARSRALASSAPVSAVIVSLIAAMHSSVARSTAAAISGSPRRSDSKTSR